MPQSSLQKAIEQAQERTRRLHNEHVERDERAEFDRMHREIATFLAVQS